MPPPGLAPAPTRRNHVSGGTEKAVKAAREQMDSLGLHFSANKLSRLVRRYLAEAATTHTFGAWVIAYADPTGETAVRNVSGGGRQ